MTTALTVIPAPFDYSVLDTDIAYNLRRQAHRIRKRIGKATQDLIDIGRDLLAAKELLEHGEFIKWVEAEVGIARRTAQAYMAIAKLAEDKGAAIALLPPTTVHRLAAKSAPPEVVSEVLAKAQSGDVLPDRMVSEMISEARVQRKRERNGRSNPFKNGGDVRGHVRPDAELTRGNHEKKTSEAAEMLLQALGANGVELVVRAFSEQEWPWDLLSLLRRRIGVAGVVDAG
ncbi:MAG TPA: DUF3102 domain-containing protein [Xanthobacteraceae bacterium]|jgi:hypothetical protein